VSSLRLLLGSVIAGTALTAGLVGVPSPASAAVASAPTALFLTVAPGESGSPVSRSAVLTCDPVGGSHIEAEQACRELATVAGDIAALAETGESCTLIYDPVTVSVEGWWHGRPTSFSATYGNSCQLHQQTRAIFHF
jgi:hypothetical protein